MAYGFEGFAGIPGIDDIRQTAEAVVLADRFEHATIRGITLDGAARDYYSADSTVLQPGLLLGRNATTLKYKQWDPGATDGSQQISGVLLYHHKSTFFNTNKDGFFGFMLWAGDVKANSIHCGYNSAGSPAAPDLNALMVGHAREFQMRAGLFSRFKLDDQQYGAAFGGWKNIALMSVVGTSGAYTITTADNDTLFVADYAGTNAWTLPTRVNPGLRFGFLQLAAQTMTITASAAQIFAYGGAKTAASIANNGGYFGEILGVINGGATAANDRWALLNHPATSTSSLQSVTLS